MYEDEFNDALFDPMCDNQGSVDDPDQDLIGDYDYVDPSLAYWYE